MSYGAVILDGPPDTTERRSADNPWRTALKGFLAWTAVAALMGMALATGWAEAFLGWALSNLAEALTSGYAES